MKKLIVVADDDPTMRSAVGQALIAAGHQVLSFPNAEEAEARIRSGGVELVISDVRMPGIGGLELLRRCTGIPFIMISGFATVPEAVEAMKMGAYDFIVKPFSYKELTALVEAALSRITHSTEDSEEEAETARAIVTAHPRMLSLLDFATQVAKSHASILIHGESGTGKELLARYIHARSRRNTGPFVAVNCAALPEGLLESELFGHERGAFTGAVVSRPGKFELAHNGTLLLDEVSEMPLTLQAKLLRVLQEREVDRLGGRKPLPVDIRVVSTTNRDLREMIRAGSFREDLFYRLNVVPLRLPPLRERVEDIEILARAFFNRRGYKRASLSPHALSKLTANPWRGNIRELFNVLERAAIVAPGGVIDAEHLLLEDDPVLWDQSWGPEGMNGTHLEEKPNSPASPRESVREPSGVTGLSVREMEEQLIFRALNEVHHNRTKAAQLLGISVRTLRNKLKQYKMKQCQEA